MKVYLAGTRVGNWRENLISRLEAINGHTVECVTPRDTGCSPEAVKDERLLRMSCDYRLHVISPDLDPFRDIADALQDCFKRPYRTIFCIGVDSDGRGFQDTESESLRFLEDVIRENKSEVVEWDKVAEFLIAKDEAIRKSREWRRKETCSMCTWHSCKCSCTEEKSKKCNYCPCRLCVDENMSGFEEINYDEED